jgi:hypothetical protein
VSERGRLHPGDRPEQFVEELFGLGFAERSEAQLRVVRLLPPLVAILGAIVDQQQNSG